ncbi:MAG TPA: M56 family metallopeptidase, partial [Bryobacteraceae bacterium]|nr:M56 family metallopeptidase [Bryobacteraceae bacterium]
MNALFNHLWQSTLFAGAVAVATLAMRKHSARTRYWFWLGASLKFLIPFSLLVWTGSRMQLPPDSPSLHAATVERISNYFGPAAWLPPAAPTRTFLLWPFALGAIWLSGISFLTNRWYRRWRSIQQVARCGTKLPLPFAVPVLSTRSEIEPGVFGIFRPMLLMPETVADHLTQAQLDAVLAHESRHVACRDNLTGAAHMCVETLFWFHPLVWWIGARLMEEREKDCDEAVLLRGSQPRDYAEGVVGVCRTYVESPLACAPGISGSDLGKRIRGIMTWLPSAPMTIRGKVILSVAAMAVLSIPLAIGIVRAQTLPPAPEYGYEVASVHRSAPGDTSETFSVGPAGGLWTHGASVMVLLLWSYDLPDYRVADAPGWLASERYDIVLTPDTADTAPGPDSSAKDALGSLGRNKQRLRAVLRDRFGLVMRVEKRELPVYALTEAKGGSKLSAVTGAHGAEINFHPNGKLGHVEANSVPIRFLTTFLSRELGRTVNDETGLDKMYSYKLEWSPQTGPNDAAPERPSLFTALTEQLGLRLEAKRG